MELKRMSDQNLVNIQIRITRSGPLTSYEAKVISKQMLHPINNFVVIKS